MFPATVGCGRKITKYHYHKKYSENALLTYNSARWLNVTWAEFAFKVSRLHFEA